MPAERCVRTVRQWHGCGCRIPVEAVFRRFAGFCAVICTERRLESFCGASVANQAIEASSMVPVSLSGTSTKPGALRCSLVCYTSHEGNDMQHGAMVLVDPFTLECSCPFHGPQDTDYTAQTAPCGCSWRYDKHGVLRSLRGTETDMQQEVSQVTVTGNAEQAT